MTSTCAKTVLEMDPNGGIMEGRWDPIIPQHGDHCLTPFVVEEETASPHLDLVGFSPDSSLGNLRSFDNETLTDEVLALGPDVERFKMWSLLTGSLQIPLRCEDLASWRWVWSRVLPGVYGLLSRVSHREVLDLHLKNLRPGPKCEFLAMPQTSGKAWTSAFPTSPR